jgi:hypothetical protein
LAASYSASAGTRQLIAISPRHRQWPLKTPQQGTSFGIIRLLSQVPMSAGRFRIPSRLARSFEHERDEA